MLSLSLSFSFSHSHEFAHETKLTHEQRLEKQQRLFLMQLDIVEAVWGRRYTPKAVCPANGGCGRELKVIEILKGFLDDPEDFTTHCPGCWKRFEPRLISRDNTGSVELPFFCASQTLHGLKGLQDLSYDDLNKDHPALLHSAAAHFGNISQAFAKIGYTYPLDAKSAWREKVKPFLGKAYDTTIAKVVGVSSSTIRRMRVKLGIAKFTYKVENN